jgi:hypothetical protein
MGNRIVKRHLVIILLLVTVLVIGFNTHAASADVIMTMMTGTSYRRTWYPGRSHNDSSGVVTNSYTWSMNGQPAVCTTYRCGGRVVIEGIEHNGEDHASRRDCHGNDQSEAQCR